MSIFDGFLSTPETLDAFGDRRFVEAMLGFEAELARAQAAEGLIPARSAEVIAGCCRIERFDVEQIARESGRAGSVAIPFVKHLKEQVKAADAAAVAHTHLGSTSQDVIDTATALVSAPAIDAIRRDLHRAAQALLAHADAHAGTPVLARTLMQPASVTSLGFKCLGWAAPLVRAHERFAERAPLALALQLGGAVGTLAQMRGKGDAVRARVAAALGLRDPGAAWHTQRDEWVALACELGLLCGSLGKIATDIALMGQYEIGELSEPSEAGRGGSSAMPHKRNPVASMVALSAALRAPQHVAALLAAMPQAHERALGPWQAELAEWPGLVMATHGSVQALAQAMPGLQIDAVRMRAHIDRLRAELPIEAADEWFDPAMAGHLAEPVREQAARLRGRLAST